jgi:hypothetical protein
MMAPSRCFVLDKFPILQMHKMCDTKLQYNGLVRQNVMLHLQVPVEVYYSVESQSSFLQST